MQKSLMKIVGWIRDPRWGWISVLVALVAVPTIAIIGVCYWGWLNENEQNSSTIRNLVLIAATVIAFPLAIWRSTVAERQADTAKGSLLNERYQKGAAMLGSDVLTVRLGGIYALQSLAREHDEYHVPIMRLFCAFVCNPTADKNDEPVTADQNPNDPPSPRLDIASTMEAIGERNTRSLHIEKKANFRLDLRRVQLCAANLEGLNLAETILSWAQLQRASLRRSNLSHAILNQADLTGARLDGAILIGATLHRTILRSACFWMSVPAGPLRFISYEEAREEGQVISADLSASRLDHAVLSNASMQGVDFTDCDLTNADLSGTKLGAANFVGAILTGTNVSNADFSCEGRIPARGLTQRQLDKAIADPGNAPVLEGVSDAETKHPLIWRGERT